MTAQLDVGKVVLGAFLVPWWNRGAFSRALAVPLIMLVTLTLSWYFASEHLPELAGWLLYVIYGALFALFAVTCHRLVLLDPQSVASRLAPRWSWRETRFFFFMVTVSLMSAGVVFALTTLILNLWMPWVGEPTSTWFSWTVAVAKIPALYLFARLCLVFPAIAIDRRVDLKWSWKLTQNNGWRLFVIVAVLPWIISQMVNLLYRGDASAIETVVLTFLGCALFAVEVAAVSLSYRELTREEAPPL